MIVVLACDLNGHWLDRISRHLAERAMVLPCTGTNPAEMARCLQVSMIVANLEPLTADRLLGYVRVRETAPEAVAVCLAPDDVREQMRSDQVPVPDFWLHPNATNTETCEILNSALEKSALPAPAASTAGHPPESGPVVASPPPTAPPPHLTTSPPASGQMQPVDQSALHQLMSALAGGLDPDRLLAGFVAAATELTHCTSHCLLWRDEQEGLTVKLSHGLHPQVAVHGRLNSADALVCWYRDNCRVLTRTELNYWPEAALAASLLRELVVFRGHAAIPISLDGQLEGLLLLGEKIVGEPYTRGELETLFMMAGYVALQLRNLRLQAYLQSTRGYMERSLSGMNCGLICLGQDDRLVVCNPYAAEVLGLPREQMEGADLRCLPSPLGDYLYAAAHSPGAAVSDLEVTLPGTRRALRVSSSALIDDEGRVMGSVLLLEDITDAAAAAADASRQETTQVLAKIIGRIAHEVRTPLTAIQTYAELMGSAGESDELNRFWQDTVRPELERLDRVIAEQVKLIEQPEPNFELVNLEQVVRESIRQLHDQLDNGKALPVVKVRAPLPRVVADPGPTRDAISYLLRFLLQRGQPPVAIEVEQMRNGAGPMVAVKMHSCNSEYVGNLADLLDPLLALQQPDGDLGPAISRQVVDKQGGQVEAHNDNGELEFRILFPATGVNRVNTSPGEAHG